MEVVSQFDEIVARNGAPGDVGLEFFRLEYPVPGTRIPSREELIHHTFCLPSHLEIGVAVDVRARGDVGPANNHGLAARMRGSDDLQCVNLLGQHAAGHDDVGLVQVIHRELLEVMVDQSDIPRSRE